MNTRSAFATLSAINCNEHTEKKGNLTYLSWAWAWKMVKDNFPEASYTIYEDANGIPYFTDGKTCWVKTGVTINGLEHIEYLPIMDYNNRSIPLERVTSMDMNKAIQRSLTKACARHGLGLYIYAGEDLPEAEEQPQPQQTQPSQAVQKRREAAGRGRQQPKYTPVEQSLFNKMVENYVHGVKSKSGEDYRTAWIEYTHAGAAEIAMFDKAVEDYMMATGMVAPGEQEYNNI
jgi:hypothetical protein